MPNANGFADFGKLPQYTQNDPMKNRPEVKGNGPTTGGLAGLIAQLQSKYNQAQRAKGEQAQQFNTGGYIPPANSFLGSQDPLQPEAPKSEGTDDILTNEQRKEGPGEDAKPEQEKRAVQT